MGGWLDQIASDPFDDNPERQRDFGDARSHALDARHDAGSRRKLPSEEPKSGASEVVSPPMDARISNLLKDAKDPINWSKESILFSACQEDSHSELSALGPLTGKRVFCVTAGGGRVLNLLLEQPRAITAVDLNPAQNALLELKVAAMRELDHGGYLRFLGVRASIDRLDVYERLRKLLSDPAAHFFDRQSKAIAAGVLFEGKLERYLRIVAAATKLGHPFGLKNVVHAPDLEAQRAAMAKWETPVWKALAHLVARRPVLAALSGDPGFYRNLPPEMPLHEVLYDRVHNHLKHNILRDNPFLQMVFFGRYVFEDVLPIYLNASTYDRVKAALAEVKLDIVTSMATEAIKETAGVGYDAFSISDISSYLDEGPHFDLFETVLGAATHNARLCSRANIYHRPLAPAHARRIERDPALERKLSRHDHATVHEFVVGKIS
jgi:S-adenosylmethionine-diacylglycerol 3-amino-3-carboxypropyl transferase